MKRPLSILLLIVFLLPQFAKVGIFISFKANQDFIAKVLCINKDKPELQCNGKCHLAKELNKTESKDQNSPITVTNKTEILLFFEKQKTPADSSEGFSVWCQIIWRLKRYILAIMASPNSEQDNNVAPSIRRSKS